MIPVLLTVVLAVSMPALAQEAPLLMSNSFGVNNTGVAAGSTVSVPLEIANVSNGSIQTIMLYMNYSESVISLESVDTGHLTAGWISNLGDNQHSITLTTSGQTEAIPNGSTGAVAHLNFLIVGGPGDTCLMTPKNIDFSNTANERGTATAKSGTVTVTVDDQEENRGVSSSGGGGGSSGASGEAYDNIEVKDVIREYITIDSVVTYEFKEDANAIGFVSFDAKTNAGYITATVEVLKSTSTLVLSVPLGEVYQNMNIWIGKSGYATENNIANPVIGFKVAKSWITENDIDESTIKLNRYSSDAWNQLPTTKTDEDDSYIYFNSETPGFSPFAITGNERSSTVVADTQDPLFSPPSSTADDDVNEPVGEVTSVPHDEAKSSNGLILVIGLIGISVLGVGMYLRKDDDWKVNK